MKKSAIILSVLLSALSAYAGWTPAVRISDQATSFGPRMAANGDTLHVVYWNHPVGTNRVFYLRSDDGGIVWAEPFLLPDTMHMFNCVNPLIKTALNKVVSIWRGNIIGGGNDLNFGLRISTNGGASWNEIRQILANDQEGLQKSTFYISNSKLFMIYSRIDQQEIVAEFTKSTNWGDTWTTPGEVFRTRETGRLDMAAIGDTIHFVWAGRFSDQYPVWETYYVKSEDAGVTWTDNMPLVSIDNWGSMYPSISINERGDIVVCWVDFKYSPHMWVGDLFVRYSHDGGDSWTEEDQITFTHTAASPRVLWHGDSIHVAWEDSRFAGGPDPFYMASYDNGLTWGAEQRIDNDPIMSYAPDLTITNNNIHVVWDDRRLYDPGRGIYYRRWEEESAIGETEGNQMPEDFVFRAYPNPFNSKTIITFKNLNGGEIDIYNITGQKIRTFKTTQNKEGRIEWDARDALGNKVSSGIYFARASGGGNIATIKLLYLK